MKRHNDDGRSIYRFANDIWVHCPTCRALAHVKWTSYDKPSHFGCLTCGLAKSADGHISEYKLRKGADPFFGYDLWLSAEFRGHILWFFNVAHLQYVRDYVAADIRERIPEVRGKANSTLTSRLPRWVKSAKNREALLKVMDKIRHEYDAEAGRASS